MRGVRKKNVLEKLGIPKRLVARAGALLGSKIDMTEAFCEYVASDPALITAVLSAEFLKLAPGAGEKKLRGFLGAHAEGAEELAAVQSDDGWTTLCLAEELAGEDAWEDSEQEPAAGAVALRRAKEEPAKAPPRKGADAPVSLETLEMQVLTSAEESDKIEALRKIGYTRAETRDKGDIFLKALSDELPRVRAEAAKLLGGLGLTSDFVDSLSALNEGNSDQKAFAVDRLSKVLKDASELETAASFITLTAVLRAETDSEIITTVLKLFGDAAKFLSGSKEREEELIRLLLGILPSNFDSLFMPVKNVLARFAAYDRRTMSKLLWAEYDKTGDKRLRFLFMLVLAGLDPKGKELEKLARLMSDEIAQGEEGHVDIRSLGAALQRFGKRSIAPLTKAFDHAVDSGKEYIITLFDNILRFTDCPEKVKCDVARLFLNVLRNEKKGCRMAVLDSYLPGDPELTAAIQQDFARAFLEHIGDFTFKRDIENAEATVVKIGLPSIATLTEYLKPTYGAVERARAVRLMGEICRTAAPESDADREVIKNMLRSLTKLTLEKFSARDALLVAMGKTLIAPVFTEDEFGIIFRNLNEALQKDPDNFAALEGLAWAAVSPACRHDTVVYVVDTLVKQLDRTLPDVAPDVKTVNDEQVFEFDDELKVYTDMLPVVITGLQHLCLRPGIDAALRNRMVNTLLSMWAEGAKGLTIWGPKNVMSIAEALTAIGRERRTPPVQQTAILKALCKKLDQIPVLLGIAEILYAADTPHLAQMATAVALTILKLRDDAGTFDDEDREYLLTALAKIISRKEIELSDRRAENLREVVVDILFEGLKGAVPKAYENLVMLRGNTTLPKKLRDDIAERLKAYESVIVY